MINIQTIVDDAIEANLYAYVETYKTYSTYKRVSENSTTKKDIKEFKEMSWRYLAEINAIEDTLIRLFPDYESYISNKLSKARIK